MNELKILLIMCLILPHEACAVVKELLE